MKRSLSIYSFEQDVDYKEAIKECAKAGYDGVEFILSTAGEINMSTTDSEVRAMYDYAKDNGLEVSSVGSWNLWEYNLVRDAAKLRESARDIVKSQIDIAQICGADTVLVIPGWVGTPFCPGIVQYDVAYDRSQEALKSLAPYAESAKVSIGIENVWNKFLLSPVEMKQFLDEIGSDYVGSYFDVGNIIYIGYPDHWMRILGKHIKKLHFCDCRFGQPGMGSFVDLLEGDVDFAAVMQAARDIGYDDWAVVEFFPNYKKFPYQSIKNAMLSLDTIFSL